MLVATGGVFVAPAVAVAQGRYQPQGAAQRHFAEGERLLTAAETARAGGDAAAAEARTREAADAFEKALEADPAYVDAYAKFGVATYSTGQSDRAIGRLQPAVLRSPDVPELAFWLGNHLLRAGRAEEGLPHLERVARQAEAFPEASLVLGTHFYKAGDLARAQTALETYLRARPDDVQARGTLGNAYFKAEKYPEALRAFEDVRRASPDNIQVQINLGTCHFQLGNSEKAVELLTDALRREPKRESVVFNLGQAYFQWKKYPEAAAQFRTFVGMKPDSFNGHYFLGSALFEAGPTQDAAALASLNEAVRLKADVAIPRYKIGLIHLRRGALDEAEKALNAARSLAPADAWIASALGTVARKRGQWDAAATLHQQAVEAAPDKARLHANLALTRAGRKQWPEAEAAATRALALDAADAFVRDAAGHALAGAARSRLAAGDAAGAETRLRQAVTAVPDSALLRADLAVALLAAGRTPEALTEAEAAHRAAPTDPSVQISRARVLLGAGKPAEARAAVESAPAAASAPAGQALLGAAALRTGDAEAALRALEAAVRAVPNDVVSTRNLAVAHLARAARELRDGGGGGAGAEALKAALKNEEALDVGLAHRAHYLALILALRRGDAGAAATWLQKLSAVEKDPTRTAPWLSSAPPGHLEHLAAFTALLNRREDRVVSLLEGSKALRNKGGAEARVLRRAYERLAERAWAGGAFGDAAKHLKAAAALGRDPVVDHNLLAVELRGNRKAKVEPKLRALSGGVPEAWFNLGVTLEAQGRHEDAYKAFLRAGQLGGAHAAKARDLAEAKRRIFGFAP
jgi:tetratricopeptide (TPR) repeat protein